MGQGLVLAYIGLGSNLGEKEANLLEAWARLGKVGGVRLVRLSGFYCTEPVGMETPFWFVNAVGVVATSLPPEKLLDALLAIEGELGRDRSLGCDRVIDLDLLLYGDLVRESENLSVPHPRMHERFFVLAPLVELAPDLVHPVLKRTMAELLRGLPLKAPRGTRLNPA